MSKVSESEIQSIVERLRLGRCVLCAGSRVSGDGTYRGLVEKLLESVSDADKGDAQNLLKNRPLALAGFVRRRLGDRFVPSLKLATASQADLPEVARLLGELPFRAIVTTSYDDTFERAFTRDGAMPKVYTPSDAAELKKDGKARFVFKALGDPARAETVVWSAEDLQGALADGGYRTVAHDLYRSRSFLFVGFDWHDAELGVLLERVLSGARADNVQHYAVLPRMSPIEREELYAIYHIRVLVEEEVVNLARALHAEMRDPRRALPDDGDFEGWLALLGEEPGRPDAVDRLDRHRASAARSARSSAAHRAHARARRGGAASRPSSRALARGRAPLRRDAQRSGQRVRRAPGCLQRESRARRARRARPAGGGVGLLGGAGRRVGQGRADAARDRAARSVDPRRGDLRRGAERRAARDRRRRRGAGDRSRLPGGAGAAGDAPTRLERWRELAEAIGRRHSSRNRSRARASCTASWPRSSNSGWPIRCRPRAATAWRSRPIRGPTKRARRSRAILFRRGEYGGLIALLEDKIERAPAAEKVVIRRRSGRAVRREARRSQGGHRALRSAARRGAARISTVLRALGRLYRDENRTRTT